LSETRHTLFSSLYTSSHAPDSSSKRSSPIDVGQHFVGRTRSGFCFNAHDTAYLHFVSYINFNRPTRSTQSSLKLPPAMALCLTDPEPSILLPSASVKVSPPVTLIDPSFYKVAAHFQDSRFRTTLSSSSSSSSLSSSSVSAITSAPPLSSSSRHLLLPPSFPHPARSASYRNPSACAPRQKWNVSQQVIGSMSSVSEPHTTKRISSETWSTWTDEQKKEYERPTVLADRSERSVDPLLLICDRHCRYESPVYKKYVARVTSNSRRLFANWKRRPRNWRLVFFHGIGHSTVSVRASGTSH